MCIRLNLNEYFFIEYCNKWAGIADTIYKCLSVGEIKAI